MLLHNYSHYSPLESVLTPSSIVDIACGMQHEAASITDLNSMAGVVQFHSAAKKAGVKPIIGLELKTTYDTSLILIAENLKGYKNLLKLLYEMNKGGGACLPIGRIEEIGVENVLCITGHAYSELYYLIESKQDPRQHIEKLNSIFGDTNVYIQTSHYTKDNVRDGLEANAEYFYKELCHVNLIRYESNYDSEYLYDVLRAKKAKKPIEDLPKKSMDFCPFFDPNLSHHVNKEICRRCEDYEITGPQKLPHFACPRGLSSVNFLREICKENFIKKVRAKKLDEQAYMERMREEIAVFESADLTDYFLIVADILNKSTELGFLNGPGRGSSAGCLTSYLLNITQIDPIKHGLSFARFYNAGRKGSMPDIDFDVPKEARAPLVEHIQTKYGKDHTGQIVTYQTFMGRSAIKAILGAEDSLSFSEINEITKLIQDKAKISDELETMKEEGREPSVILWALENRANKLDNWASLKEDKIEGPYGKQFELAIKLERIKSAQAKHAAGVIISQDPLADTVPTLYDKDTKEVMVGMEYEDAEKSGCIKLDLLGLTSLSKLQEIERLTK